MAMKKRFNLGYYLVEGVHSIFTHGLMSFAAVLMIVACLLIMGSFSLVAVNLEQKMEELEDKNVFLAFVDETYTRVQAEAVGEKIAAVPNVAFTEFVTKEQAKANFEEEHAEDSHAGLYSDLPADLFRDRYVVYIEDISQLMDTVNAVEQVEGVDGHQANPEVSDGLLMIRNIAASVATILVILLLLISLFIIYNTIKLGTFTRREEIAIMKMVGATNGFVRGPFIFEGMILGLFGAVVAFFAQWGIYELIEQAINTQQSIPFLDMIPFSDMASIVLLVFAITGFVVGTGGSVLAIRKFLQV